MNDLEKIAYEIGQKCYALCLDYDDEALIPPVSMFADRILPILKTLVTEKSTGGKP